MTNREFLINKIAELSRTKRTVAEEIFDIVREYDWAVFCSQMADYDMPHERVQAEKVMNEKLAKMVEDKKASMTEVFNVMSFFHCKMRCEMNRFYSKHFHSMNEEYVADC